MPVTGPPVKEPNPIASMLRRGLAAGGDRLALFCPTRCLTWDEIDALSDRLANAYLDRGLTPGDRVATLMPNRPALIIHYLACIKAGLVATPLNYRYMPPEIDHALEVSGASLLLTHVERDDDVAESKLAQRLSHGIVRYGKSISTQVDGYEELLSRGVQETPLPTVPMDAPAFIYFTSGSTGKPKGVTHTHATIGSMMACSIQCLQIEPQDIVLPAASCSHIGGSMFSLCALAAGAKLVLPRTGAAGDVLPLLRQHNPSVLWMLPSALVTLIRDHEARSADFASIRLCLSGGDKVSAKLESEFTEFAGTPIDEGYGMTEIGCATVNPIGGENRIGSVGKFSPGYQGSIRDDAGNEVKRGESGRLWIQSPANSIGYWQNPQATAETIVDGWLDTGDIMLADDDDYLWFRGRKKQIIIHDGSNICPQEVEEALMDHSAVCEVGVVGVHDLVHGENVRAYVTLRDGEERPSVRSLIDFARARIGYKAPDQIVFLSEMPLNATGKVDRTRLKKRAEAHLDLTTGGQLDG
ncbi:MAG: class I adenylate-forming enzyme family protein [Rubripirellula sp.]